MKRFPLAKLLALGVALAATPAFAGPDFVTGDRAKPLAASDAHNEQQPMDDIVFTYDGASLLPTAQAQLVSAARWLAHHPYDRLVLEGYADSAGPRAYNTELAARRAEIARNHLIANGVDADRIVVAVYGEQGVHRRPHPLDRRVVMFASRAPVARLVTAELARHAVELSWTRDGARYHESRGITPAAVATRR
jgi:OmpA family